MTPQVIIGVPVFRQVELECMLSVCRALKNYPQWIRNVQTSKNTYIDTARNEIAEVAHDDHGATHLWFIDDDMDIPDDALPRLLELNRPVVGGWYCNRDGESTAWYLAEENGEHGSGYRVEPLRKLGTGVEQVGGLPMGCTLIETRVLRQMSQYFEDKNWFVRDGIIGEDVWFSLRLRELNIASYLHNGIECVHMKTVGLSRRMCEQREKMATLTAA